MNLYQTTHKDQSDVGCVQSDLGPYFRNKGYLKTSAGEGAGHKHRDWGGWLFILSVPLKETKINSEDQYKMQQHAESHHGLHYWL